MFEQLSQRARTAVVQATQQARQLGSPAVEPGHLLLGLLAEPGSVAAQAIAGLGVDQADAARRVRAELAQADRRGGLDAADAAALADLGIDVEAVVRRVEESFGPGALAARQPACRNRRSARRRQRPASVRVPFGPDAKRMLERCLAEARELGHGYIGTEHMLLAILADRHGPAYQALASYGLDYPAARAQVVDLLRRAS
jgi:ATP-dependent Clp protease ATP-binding subunit ClpA